MEVKAVSNPRFPLDDSASKNLMKLYLNDVGLLTHVLYDTNINVVLRDEKSINLGSVYENVVAQELRAHGFKLYYYDNKKTGEVDYLVNDASRAIVLPIEVKSGKDYTEHSALDKFLETKEYKIDEAVVLSNEGRVYAEKGIWYEPVYYVMFMERSDADETELPELQMPEE